MSAVVLKEFSWELKDKVHLMDMLEVGLIDESWCSRLPPEIAGRLKELLDEREREASPESSPGRSTRLDDQP